MENFAYKIEDYAEKLKPSLKQRNSMYVKVFNQNPGKGWAWARSTLVSPMAWGLYITAGALVLPVAYVGVTSPNRMYDFDSIARVAQENRNSGGLTVDFNDQELSEDYQKRYMVSPSYSFIDGYYYAQGEDNVTPQGQRMVDRDGELVIESSNPTEILQLLKNLVSREGGYIMSSSLATVSGRSVAQIRLQVPVEKFDTFLAEISKMPITVISENINLRDVQNQYSGYLETMKGIDEKIKVAQQKVEKATTKTAEELAKKELASLKAQKSSIQSSIDNLTKGVALSSLQVEVRSLSGFNLLGRTWSSWEEVGRFLVNFWGQVLILAAPAVLILGIVFRKKIWRFVRSKVRINWKQG